MLRLRAMHANAKPVIRAERRQSSVSNYFIGNDRSQWRSNVANYAAIRYEQIYPGIDWVVYGNPRQLEYDFIVAPRADPRQIELYIEGARALSVDDNGDLLVKVRGVKLRQLKPVIYQTAVNGERRPVDGHYVLDHQHYGFALGEYDRSRPLIIDPAFVYSTYLGGSGGDSATAIAIDNVGNSYLAGQTTSSDFPTEKPFQTTNHNRQWGNAFVAKLNATGTALVYSTYLGGSGNTGFGGDGATAIAVDATGNAYVAGYTASTDFPTVGAIQPDNGAAANEGTNAFVTKLNAAGNAMMYSTYLGGSGRAQDKNVTGDSASAIAVDAAGNAYVAGSTTSMDFPILNAFQGTNRSAGGINGSNGFVSKLNPSGGALVYSTYLGGSFGDIARGIAVDRADSAYVVGSTASIDFPTKNPFQATNNAMYPVNYLDHNATAFVTKFSAAGNALVYSTYLGGHSEDDALAIAVDALGSAYVAGSTQSSDFPTANAFQEHNRARGGGDNAFVTKFNAAGSALIFSTYLGGGNDDAANSIAVDGWGNAYIAGVTYSDDFPVADPLQGMNNGAANGAPNAFISVLHASGDALVFSTYLGGKGSLSAFQPDCVPCAPIYNGDNAAAIAVDNFGNLYVAGATYSTDFPTVTALQGANKAANTATSGTSFVTKIAMGPPRAGGWRAEGGGGSLGWAWISMLTAAVAVRCFTRRRSGFHGHRNGVARLG
jgi:hypothetical protein